jgi:hypothetical protein
MDTRRKVKSDVCACVLSPAPSGTHALECVSPGVQNGVRRLGQSECVLLDVCLGTSSENSTCGTSAADAYFTCTSVMRLPASTCADAVSDIPSCMLARCFCDTHVPGGSKGAPGGTACGNQGAVDAAAAAPQQTAALILGDIPAPVGAGRRGAKPPVAGRAGFPASGCRGLR